MAKRPAAPTSAAMSEETTDLDNERMELEQSQGNVDIVARAIAELPDDPAAFESMTEVGADRPLTSPDLTKAPIAAPGEGGTLPVSGETKAPTGGTAAPSGETKGAAGATAPGALIDPAAALAPKPAGAGDADAELFAEPEEIKGNPKAQERFQKLVTQVKEGRAKLEAFEPRLQSEVAAHTALRQAVESFRAEPEELDRLARFSRAMKTGTPEALQYAWQEIETYRNMVAQALGIRTDQVDPLTQHPDLQGLVTSMQMPRETALAEAARRNQHQLTLSASQRDQAARQQAFERDSTRNAVIGEIQRHELTWMASPDYLAPLFVGTDGQPTTMQRLVADYTTQITHEVMRRQADPRVIPQVVAQYQQTLAALIDQQRRQAPPPAHLPGGNGARPPQAMRPTHSSAGGVNRTAAPNSTLDAITAALA